MENYNRKVDLQLSTIPLAGINPNITCSQCPSACCRKGMAVELSPSEAEMMQDNGTDLLRIQQQDLKRLKQPKPRKNHDYYEFLSDCGNLAFNAITGETGCTIYETDAYPQACRDFKMGSAACALTQLQREAWGEDSFPNQP